MEMWKCHTERKQVPVADEDSQAFWEGCRRHRLLIQQCEACQAFRFPPSPLCPHCLSPLSAWRPDPGDGEVLTYCVYHVDLAGPAWQPDLPYVVAVVRLAASGVTILSNIIGPTRQQVRIGAAVRLTFEPADAGVVLPKFVLCELAGGRQPA